ncbi:MAG: histidine phosphatase family protein [Hyphomicrobiaceae bacterium]|nr:histidine phosphatase family protein [Hyphomicrobiaceae bacterium]
MLTLLLLRHAKSSWDHVGLSDHDRPLAERGRNAAPRMAAHIAAHDLAPQLVLCSTSVRTRETLALVLGRLKPAPSISYEKGLYLAEAETLLDRIHKVGDDWRRIMLLGHNPGFEDLARMLSGHGERASLEALQRKFPTCGLAVITFKTSRWANVRPGQGTLDQFLTPRSLDGNGA